MIPDVATRRRWRPTLARLFTCKSRLTQRARGSIYRWGSSAAAPAPSACSGNSPHTRRSPWQPPGPSGAAISTSSSFFLFGAAPQRHTPAFAAPGKAASHAHTQPHWAARPSLKHQSWLSPSPASPAAHRGRWCSRHCTHATARRSVSRRTGAHTHTHTRASHHREPQRDTQHFPRASISESHQKFTKVFKTLRNVDERWPRQLKEGRQPSVRHRLPEPTASAALSAASK